MSGVHPMGDLAPRDIVARAITDRLAAGPGGVSDHVLLDTTRLGRETIATRFPTMVAACAAIGIDPAAEPVPVAPAEHFLCGGVRTDAWGRTGVVGLTAVGEVAATGAHGANRLASNSLLEGLVFGARAGERLAAGLPDRHDPAPSSPPPEPGRAGATHRSMDPDKVRSVLSQYAGIRRDAGGLATAVGLLDSSPQLAAAGGPGVSGGSDADLLLVARSVVAAAAARPESRGCHWRADAPAPAPEWALRRVEVIVRSGSLHVRTTTREQVPS